MFPIYSIIINMLLQSGKIKYVELQKRLRVEHLYHPNDINTAISELLKNEVIKNEDGLYLPDIDKAKKIKPYTDNEILQLIFEHLFKFDESAMTIDSINNDLKMALTEVEKKYYDARLKNHNYINRADNGVIKLSSFGRIEIFQMEREKKAKAGRIGHPKVEYYITEVDKEKSAYEFIDILFPYFPDDTIFNIKSIITDYQAKENKTFDEISLMRDLRYVIRNLLVMNQYVYVIEGNEILQLNVKGKERKRSIMHSDGIKSSPVEELSLKVAPVIKDDPKIKNTSKIDNQDKPKSERIIDKIKNHKTLSIIIVIAFILAAFFTFSNLFFDFFDKIMSHLHPNSNKVETRK